MSGWKISLLLLLLICAAAAVGFWFGRDSQASHLAADTKGEESAPPVPAVQTQPLTIGSIAQTVEAFGTVQPEAGSLRSVSTQFDARVNRVIVSPGASVTAETPVAEIGPTSEAQLQFRQAKDALAAAEHSLAQVRQRFSEQLATNSDVSIAEQAQRTAKTQVDNLIERGIQASGTIAAGSAGIVTQIYAQAGQVVAAGSSLLVINSQDHSEAIIGVAPAAALLLKVDDKAALNDVYASDETLAVVGTIRRIGQQVNSQTRLRDVAVSLPQDAPLPSGSFVVAQLTTATAEGLVAPRSAVLPDGDDQVVYIVVDGKAKRCAVKVGLKNREQVQLLSDELHVGDAIVTVGNAELEDGMAVQVGLATTEPTTTATGSPAENK